MKASELRIGSWCNIVKSPFESEIGEHQIEAITIHYFESGDDLVLKPIPLTEEWLLKLGAEENEGCFIHDRFKLQFHDTYKFWYVFDVTLMAYITKVEFVHEWQNVYFALNGEELTVK